MFDDLILMGKGGHVIYAGPREKVLDYFESTGFRMPDASINPADFIMDVASNRVSRDNDPDFTAEKLGELWKSKSGIASINSTMVVYQW